MLSKIDLDKKIKYISLAVISSFIFYLSMPGNIEIFSIVMFLPLFFIKEKTDIYLFMIYSFFWSIFSGILIYYPFIEYSNLIFYYSIFLLSIQICVPSFFLYKKGFISFAFGIVCIEFLRTLGPFAFSSNFALCFWKYTNIIQIASYLGIYGVTLLIIFINYLIYILIFKNKFKKVMFLIVLILSVLLLSYNNNVESKSNNIKKVSIIQGSVPVWMYSMENYKQKYRKAIDDIYIGMTEKNFMDSDIVIWPETAIRKYIFGNTLYYKEFFKSLIIKKDTSFIIGTPHLDNDKEETNSVFLLEKDVFERYDKIRTVPIVEDFYKKGEKPHVLNGKDLIFSPVICFESIFERNILKQTQLNADLIVVITNDAGFKKSVLSYLHASYSVFRAIENKRPVLRAAQSGISMIIDENGNILTRSELFKPEVLKGYIKTGDGRMTFFSEYYIFVIILFFIIFFISIFV